MKYKVYVDWLTQWGKDYLSHLKQIFQGKLTAGDNITIEDNVISASGGAENVQSDWNETDTTSDAYIQNKPSNIVSDASYVHTDNNYTTAEKNKLQGISSGAEVNVQSNWNESDNTSDAFIQNKPNIPTALSDLTDDSTHRLVTDTEKSTWNGKQNALTFDSTPTENSTKPVTSGGIKTALDTKQDTLTYDTVPTDDSEKMVKSGGIKTALDTKQDTLIFDTTPTANSTKPVTSGGVYDAISKPDLYEVNIFYDYTSDKLKIPTEYTQLGYAVYKNGEDITNTITNFKTFVDGLNNTNNILKFYSVKNPSTITNANHRELLRNYTNSNNVVTSFNVYNSDVVGTIRFMADNITCTFKESTIDVVDRIVENTYGCHVHIVLDVTNIPHISIDLDNLMFANVEDYVRTIKYAKYKVNKASYNYDTEVTYTDSIVKFINNVLPSLKAHYNLSITVEITKSTGESSWESRIFYAEYINHGINEPYDNYLKLSYELDAGDIYDYPQNSMRYVGLIVVPGVEYPEETSYCRFARVDTDIATKQYVDSYYEFLDNYSEEEF